LRHKRQAARLRRAIELALLGMLAASCSAATTLRAWCAPRWPSSGRRPIVRSTPSSPGSRRAPWRRMLESSSTSGPTRGSTRSRQPAATRWRAGLCCARCRLRFATRCGATRGPSVSGGHWPGAISWSVPSARLALCTAGRWSRAMRFLNLVRECVAAILALTTDQLYLRVTTR
jgi:hypothetical protein